MRWFPSIEYGVRPRPTVVFAFTMAALLLIYNHRATYDPAFAPDENVPFVGHGRDDAELQTPAVPAPVPAMQSLPAIGWAPDVSPVPDSFIPPVISGGRTESAGGSSRMPDMEALRLIGEAVTYQANRRLEMIAATYDLTEEQRSLMFPVIARASKAYHPALPVEGAAESDAFIRQLGLAAQDQGASAGVDDPLEQTDLAARVLASAPDLGIDDLESMLVPFLDEEQLAWMDEEQIDRHYWWEEILVHLQYGAQDDGEAVVSSGAPAEPASDPVAGASDADALPVSRPGGALFDFFNP